MFMCAVVVRNQMYIQLLGCLPVNLLEKVQPLHMGMFLLGSTDNLAIEIIQGGKQRDRTMADIVVRMSSDVTDAQRKSRGCVRSNA